MIKSVDSSTVEVEYEGKVYYLNGEIVDSQNVNFIIFRRSINVVGSDGRPGPVEPAIVDALLAHTFAEAKKRNLKLKVEDD